MVTGWKYGNSFYFYLAFVFFVFFLVSSFRVNFGLDSGFALGSR